MVIHKDNSLKKLIMIFAIINNIYLIFEKYSANIIKIFLSTINAIKENTIKKMSLNAPFIIINIYIDIYPYKITFLQ